MIERLIENIERFLPNKIVRRIVLHSLFWVVWLGRNFYDTYQPFGYTGGIFYVGVVFISQLPLVYIHLYLFIPKLLKQKKYVLYFTLTAVLLFAYSWMNYKLMNLLPDEYLPESMIKYIKRISPAYDILEGFIVIILTYSLKYTLIAYITQNELLKLQKEKLQLELNSLKAQINPHFFFNTLNNLYSLTLKNSVQSSEVVLKLSDIMRYVLYECNDEKVLLSKELQFISNYLELEKLRYNNKYQIDFKISGDIQDQKIAPMMLIEFVENAFKHGLNRQYSDAWLRMGVEVTGNEFKFEIENSKPDAEYNPEDNLASGIGLQNVKKRLLLLYPSHKLILNDAENYKVQLNIILS